MTSILIGQLLVCVMGLAAVPAMAELPKRNFVVEIRQVEERDTSGYTASTTPQVPLRALQRVVVRNGEKATLRFNVSVPMQWVQKLEALSPTASTTASSTQTLGTGVTHALVWMDGGQSVVVSPRWPGAKHPVSVEVDIQAAAVDQRTGAELPDQWRSQTVTTVDLALGEWVTLATEGQPQKVGTYSSSAAHDVARSLQIRVTTE